jgi:hypothetical protein
MPSRIRIVLAGALAPFFFAAAAPVQAQSLGRLLACQDVPRAEERLACYDAAARTAIGLGGAPQRTAEGEISRRAAELDAREAKLAEREALVKKLEAAVRDLKTKVVSTADSQSAGLAAAPGDLSEREAALRQREDELKAREAKLAALPAAKAEEESTLFGIPIPFTRKDTFNQQTDANGVTIERDSDGDVDAIRAAVREWSLTGDGMMIVVLENGQVWRQTEGAPLRMKSDESVPNVARISRAALGSFMMTVNDSSKSIKVRRVDGKKPKS